MEKISTVGVDLAKSSFTVCGLNSEGKQILRKEFKREKFADFLANTKKCLIIMEACGGSNYWARKAKQAGHDVKVIAPQKVVAFRKNNKNDKNDALAICYAGLCPGMEFVPIKSESQQDIQSILRLRQRLKRSQTALLNEIRGLLSENGIIIPQGIRYARGILSELSNGSYTKDNKEILLSTSFLNCIKEVNDELLFLTKKIDTFEKLLIDITKQDERCAKLQGVPGVGPLIAATVVSSLINPQDYKNGRQYAASLGLTPRHVQTGGKDSKPIELGISKHGNAMLRSLLVQGGMSVANSINTRRKKMKLISNTKDQEGSDSTNSNKSKNAANGLHPHIKPKSPLSLPEPVRKKNSSRKEEWVLRLMDEKCIQKAAVAIANKNARIILSIMKSGKPYDPEHSEGYLVAK